MDYLAWFYTVFYISLTSAGLVFAFSVVMKPGKNLRLIQLLLLVSFLADFISGLGRHAFDQHIPYTGAIYRLLELLNSFGVLQATLSGAAK